MRLNIKNFIIIVLIGVAPQFVLAQGKGSSAKQRKFIFEINSALGYGSAQAASDATVPSIGSFNLGVGIGFNIKRLSLGVGYDYRILTQYSEVVPTVGNRRGDLSTLAPFVGLNFDRIKFGFNPVLSGQYNIMNKTLDGKKLSYHNPSGFKFNLRFKEIKRMTPVLYYESISFSEKQVDGAPTALDEKLTYTNYGIGITYGF